MNWNRPGFISRRIYLCILIGFIFLNTTAFASQHPVRFGIFGDRTSGIVPGIYGQIAEEIERMKPDFVMTVGDMIDGDIEDSLRIEARWTEYLEIVSGLSMPIYYTPGNNDIWSDLSERIYRKHAGEPYYSFDHESLHFVILDNSRWDNSEEIPGGQIEWLKTDLKRHAHAGYTLVFFHKPFWNESIVLGKADTLHDIFVEYGVDAVFSGHYHQYFCGRYDGIIYTNIGSSGGGMTPLPSELGFHFAWVTVDEKGIHIAPIHKDSILPWDIITATERKLCQRLAREGLYFKEALPVDETGRIADAEAFLIIDNSFARQPLNQEIRWSVPKGWRVSPETIPVDLPVGGEKVFPFRFSCTGPLFPVPSVSIDFAYSKKNTTVISSDLKLSRSVECMEAVSPVVIDGKISESFWKNPTTTLFHPQGGYSVIDPVEFYFAFDKSNLYLAADCSDGNIDSLVARATGHDEAIYLEDCIGYFIEPESGKGTVYQIYINPLGTVFDQLITIDEEGYTHGDREWNGVYEIKAVIEEAGWAVECRIPLDQWNVQLQKNDTWRVNFRRKQPRLSSAGDWQVPINYDPGTFGNLVMR